MRFDTIPQDLKLKKNWVCALNGSKMPLQAYLRKAASTTLPDTWSTFEGAKRAVDNGQYDYLGFVFDGDGIIGIDIDKGYDEDGFLSELSIDCMRACRSYTEQSRSGRGIHIYVRGHLPFTGANNRDGVEIYSSKRYFIVTGERLIYNDIIENQAGLDYIIAKYFPQTEREKETGMKDRIYSPVYKPPVGSKISISVEYPQILPGMRNISLTSLAGQLHTQGYTPKQIFIELLRANEQACEPPLPRDEVRNIVRSVTRYAR